MPVCLSVCLFLCPYVCVLTNSCPLYLFVCLSVYSRVSVGGCVLTSEHNLYPCLSVCLSVLMFQCLYSCLSVCTRVGVSVSVLSVLVAICVCVLSGSHPLYLCFVCPSAYTHVCVCTPVCVYNRVCLSVLMPVSLPLFSLSSLSLLT